MPPLSRSAFAELIDGLSPPGRREFLADLYAARGWETRVEGDSVYARDGETVRELRLATEGSGGDAAGTETDSVAAVRVLDTAALYRLSLYAIDRADCDALFRAHFDRPLPPPEEGPDRTIARQTGNDGEKSGYDGGTRRNVTAPLLALVVALALIGGTGAYAAVGSLDGPAVDGGDGGRTVGPTAGAGGTEKTATPTDSTPFPPGVTRAGVTDPATLGAAHEASIDGKGYVLLSNRTVRYGNGTLRSRLTLRVALGANGTYLADAATAGPHAPTFLGRPPARGTYWSNGTLYLRRMADRNTTTYNSFVPPRDIASPRYWVSTIAFGGRFGDSPAGFFESVFASVPTRIEVRTPGSTDTYRLADQGTIRTSDPAFAGEVSNVRDAVLVARVDEHGVVRSLHLGYTGVVEGETVRVERDVAYRAIDNTTVGRPPWFGKALGE